MQKIQPSESARSDEGDFTMWDHSVVVDAMVGASTATIAPADITTGKASGRTSKNGPARRCMYSKRKRAR